MLTCYTPPPERFPKYSSQASSARPISYQSPGLVRRGSELSPSRCLSNLYCSWSIAEEIAERSHALYDGGFARGATSGRSRLCSRSLVLGQRKSLSPAFAGISRVARVFLQSGRDR